MEEKEVVILLAGRKIAITPLTAGLQPFLKDYLTDGDPDFSVIISPEDILYEREKSAREDILEGHAVRRFSDGYLETLAVYRKIAANLLADDILLFHGSAIAVDGEAYIFTAKSGTGKSTHARLWREMLGERAVMINDDKPLIRITQGGAIVYGTPWDGKHRLSANIAVPLKAICILERGDNNRIAPISRREALPMLLQQSYRPAESAAMMKAVSLADRLGGAAALYHLQCNMEAEAAQISYKAMSEGREQL